MSEVAALVVLLASLGAAIARPRWAPDWVVAAAGALLLVLAGVLGVGEARHVVARFGPTIGFLAALLVLGDGCRRAGLFEALGVAMALGAGGRPRRLLALVFVVAAATTAVLSLDATIVLLTPIVYVTAARLRTSARPHVYACTHLANSASLLLPVSNLTNLLAFQASGLSFTRFGALMVLPWLIGLAIEWVVLSRSFAGELQHVPVAAPDRGAGPELPSFALVVLALTLLGFGLSSVVSIAPVWVATGAAVVMAARVRLPALEAVRAAEPAFLIFVLALAIIVQGASQHGLASAVDSLLPHGAGLPALLGVAGLSAVLANLLNNLPATLIIVPVVVAGGPGAVLAMLIGVNVGPNLTYAGSLATLLWRRVVHAHEQTVDLREFTRLGALTVPPILLASTVALWLALRVV